MLIQFSDQQSYSIQSSGNIAVEGVQNDVAQSSSEFSDQQLYSIQSSSDHCPSDVRFGAIIRKLDDLWN